MSKTYGIGYGKPPKKSQWKPGQSGNPAGKKPKVKNNNLELDGEFARQLSSSITVTKNGKKKAMTYFEALIMCIISDLMKASLKEKMLFLEKLERFGVWSALRLRSPLHEDDCDEFSEADKRLLQIARSHCGLLDDDLDESGDVYRHDVGARAP